MRIPPVVFLLLRFLVYAILIAFAFEGLIVAVNGWGAHWVMQDDGPIEDLQLATVFTAGVVFWVLSRRRPASADVMRICSALAFMACARELDNFTLQLGWRSGYLAIAAFPLGWALWTLATARGRFFDQLVTFSRTTSFALLLAGFLVVVVYAQLIGQKALWLAVLDADVYRPIKEIVEESSELLGYLLLLFGAIEAAVEDTGR